MGRLEYQKSSAVMVSLVAAPAFLVHSVSNAHVTNNLLYIQQSLDIGNVEASWLVNIEVIISIFTSILTGKLGLKYGTCKIFTLGVGIFAISNFLFVIPAIEHSVEGTYVLRCFSSIGLGLFFPTTETLANEYVLKSKFSLVVSIMSISTPIGNVVSSLIAGTIATHSSWRFCFVMVGCLSLILLVIALTVLPFTNEQREAIKINYVGVMLLGISVCMFVGILCFFGSNVMSDWIIIVVALISVGFIVLFFFYNQRWAADPLFTPDIFNKSTSLTLVCILLSKTLTFMERYFESFIYEKLHGISLSKSGIIMGVTGLGAIFFSPLGNFLFKRVCNRIMNRIFFALYGVFQLVNGFMNLYFFNLWFFIFLNLCCVGFNIIMTVNNLSYNFQQAPVKYSNEIGVLNSCTQNIGHSLGVSLAVAVNNLAIDDIDNIVTSESVAAVYFASFAFCAALVILSFFMGVFQYERGKKGFTESAFEYTITYEDNLITDDEVIEVNEYTGEKSEDKKTRILKLFNQGDIY